MHCTQCKTDCGDGYYVHGNCNGTTSYDVTTCELCTTCDEGQWLDGWCNGTTRSDNITCRDCVSSCDENWYLDGHCNGLEHRDNVTCNQYRCPLLQYKNFERHDGLGRLENVLCSACTSECDEGQYITGVLMACAWLSRGSVGGVV